MSYLGGCLHSNECLSSSIMLYSELLLSPTRRQNNFRSMYSRFKTIPGLDGRTDGQKDYISIARQILMRDNK